MSAVYAMETPWPFTSSCFMAAMLWGFGVLSAFWYTGSTLPSLSVMKGVSVRLELPLPSVAGIDQSSSSE